MIVGTLGICYPGLQFLLPITGQAGADYITLVFSPTSSLQEVTQ